MFRPRVPKLLFIFASFWLLFISASSAFAQTETWQPATTGFQTEIRVWTSGDNTFAEVRLIFPNSGYRVNWGQVTRTGNNFTADAKVERWTGASAQMITTKEFTYNLGVLSQGTYTFTFRSWGATLKTEQFDPSLIAEHWEPTSTIGSGQIGVRIWTTAGITNTKVELYFPATGYRVADWGQVSRSGNEFTVDVKTERFTGESEGRTIIADHDYVLGALAPGTYTLVVKLQGLTGRTQPFTIQGSPSATAPKIVAEENAARAVALDSVTWTRLFPVITEHNFSPDQRARIMLFATDIASNDQNAAAVTVQVEDAQHNFYDLTVEHVGKVQGFDWLTQIIARPPDALKSGGDVWVQIKVNGVASNRALINIKPADANQ